GLALAILAWLQTLPEFAVEAVIAWDAGRDPERAYLAIAYLTGAIRLLLGLGWPLIYLVFAAGGRKQDVGTGAAGAQHAAHVRPAGGCSTRPRIRTSSPCSPWPACSA